jgi:hypothetical protein
MTPAQATDIHHLLLVVVILLVYLATLATVTLIRGRG